MKLLVQNPMPYIWTLQGLILGRKDEARNRFRALLFSRAGLPQAVTEVARSTAVNHVDVKQATQYIANVLRCHPFTSSAASQRTCQMVTVNIELNSYTRKKMSA